MVSLLVLFPIVLLTSVTVRLISNWRRLSKVPGPAFAGATDLWRAYQQYNGKLRQKLLDPHSQHGPIVRYGVSSISISDPEVINVVYGSRAGFIIADSYKVLVSIQNGKEVPSLVSTADEARHGALRRSVANAFTPTAALGYERWIDVTIAELLGTIRRKTTFDLSSMILWYTMDAAGLFSFGEPLGCLAAENDVNGSIQLIRDRFNHWGWWSSVPQLERLVYRNPIAMRQKRAPSSMAAAALAKLKPRHGGVVGMLMSTISGAGDTKATTVTAALFNLLRNPNSLKKLEDELSQANLPEIPDFALVNKLPYLNAVIKESMRVFPTATWPMERLVPAGGATIAGMFFPEGMEAAHMGFSRGRRNFLGQNIAVMQMKKVIPALIMKFKDGPVSASDYPLSSFKIKSEAVFNMTGFRGFTGTFYTDAPISLRSHPEAQYIEGDAVMTASAAQTKAPWGLARIPHKQRGNPDHVYDVSADAGTCSQMTDTGTDVAYVEFGGRAVLLADFAERSNSGRQRPWYHGRNRGICHLRSG
ncbi:hypothetical protein DL765_003339 [Monosporascus sp. GIB2]|nr:hypothetical protein DL765_003339 [Monosporascus sp. GIB2]